MHIRIGFSRAGTPASRWSVHGLYFSGSNVGRMSMRNALTHQVVQAQHIGLRHFTGPRQSAFSSFLLMFGPLDVSVAASSLWIDFALELVGLCTTLTATPLKSGWVSCSVSSLNATLFIGIGFVFVGLAPLLVTTAWACVVPFVVVSSLIPALASASVLAGSVVAFFDLTRDCCGPFDMFSEATFLGRPLGLLASG